MRGRIVVIDFIVATFSGIAAESFWVFLALCMIALPFVRVDKPYRSGLLRLALMLLGISALFSLFGGDGCDCDS
jgi:hypothetical protein